ncbi:MAG: zinc-binding protein [Chloroflexi bacterium]|nr:zinc-binding protein [Chloroflexota bacterium]MBM3176207.1 zinc-binding protein [Chloroflexota bacterium]MBM4450747.1 zinc-binding protein [Chloroflexota bacterium]
MSFQDKSVHCSVCGTIFSFSAEEQGFFQSWGCTNEPKRCPSCRQSRKVERHRNGGSDRRMFRATCADCGRDTEVPFEPRRGRRVYCSDCYRKVRPNR